MFGTSNKYIPHKSLPQSSILHSSPPPNPPLPSFPLNPIPTYLISPYIILQSSSNRPPIVLYRSPIVHLSSYPSPLFLTHTIPPIYTPILPYISPKTHTTLKLSLTPKRVFVTKSLYFLIDKYLKTLYRVEFNLFCVLIIIFN